MSKNNSKQRQDMSDTLEEFFHDYYKHRHKVYWFNFVRGIWFGLGSVIGGTLVVAAVLWLLSVLNQIPFIDDIAENIQRTLEQPD